MSAKCKQILNGGGRNQRDSNMELLRIIAMFFVCIIHTVFFVAPKYGIQTNATLTIIQLIVKAFVICAVDTFVLLSGWYGIKFSYKGLFKFLFQCFFFFFGIYISFVIFFNENLSFEGLKKCLLLTENGWFMKAYLGLFILAPVLNNFRNNIEKNTYKRVLLLFFTFQSVYGWYSHGAAYFDNGFSTISFIGLYLLAGYIKRFSPSFTMKSAKYDLLAYCTISIVNASFMYLFLVRAQSSYYEMCTSYTNPLVILSALMLLLAFSKIKFQSKFVNWIASSCFAVLCMHFMIWEKIMHPMHLKIDSYHDGIIEIIMFASLTLAFFTVSVLLDKIRMFFWNQIINYTCQPNVNLT